MQWFAEVMSNTHAYLYTYILNHIPSINRLKALTKIILLFNVNWSVISLYNKLPFSKSLMCKVVFGHCVLDENLIENIVCCLKKHSYHPLKEQHNVGACYSSGSSVWVCSHVSGKEDQRHTLLSFSVWNFALSWVNFRFFPFLYFLNCYLLLKTFLYYFYCPLSSYLLYSPPQSLKL